MQEQRLIIAIILQAFDDLNIDITDKRKVGGNSLYERMMYRNWAINFFNDNDFKWLVEKIDREFLDSFESIKHTLKKSYEEYTNTLDKIKIEKYAEDLPLFSERIIFCK